MLSFLFPPYSYTYIIHEHFTIITPDRAIHDAHPRSRNGKLWEISLPLAIHTKSAASVFLAFKDSLGRFSLVLDNGTVFMGIFSSLWGVGSPRSLNFGCPLSPQSRLFRFPFLEHVLWTESVRARAREPERKKVECTPVPDALLISTGFRPQGEDLYAFIVSPLRYVFYLCLIRLYYSLPPSRHGRINGGRTLLVFVVDSTTTLVCDGPLWLPPPIAFAQI
jgi:hypothetical protein